MKKFTRETRQENDQIEVRRVIFVVIQRRGHCRKADQLKAAHCKMMQPSPFAPGRPAPDQECPGQVEAFTATKSRRAKRDAS
jgi:hypothetical protein